MNNNSNNNSNRDILMKSHILKKIKEVGSITTTSEIASIFKISWNTAQVHLLKLLAEKIVRYKKVGRQNQFWLNKNYRKYFKKK